jgi:ParB/Sulfiredoxin domain
MAAPEKMNLRTMNITEDQLSNLRQVLADGCLKVNKIFIPCSVAENDEIYANGMFMFNITKMLEYINANLADFPIEYVAVDILDTGFAVITESHVDSVDISTPVILAKITPNQYNLIDGNHRVEKARRLKIEKLPVYRLTVDQHINFLIDKESYPAYIKYWNSKLEQIQRYYHYV